MTQAIKEAMSEGQITEELKKMQRLHEAFTQFTSASKALEQSYADLKGRVRYLTDELGEKNRALAGALAQTEEAKDYLGGILESLSEAIIVVDTAGTVTMANAASGRMLGMSTEGIVGAGFASLGIPEDADEAWLAASRLDVIVSRSAITDAEGMTRGHVVLLQDITRLKELEAAQERNHRLIAMGEMAAKIVHEIRSPLCSIELYASMLARDLGGTPNAEMAEGISSGIRSLNNVLTNMLFFAKPRKAALRPSEVCRAIEPTVYLLKPMAASHGLTIAFSGGPGVLALFDLELIKQVLMNIILNAIQAAPSGSEVAVTCSERGGAAVIEVHDDGPGISREDAGRIFDPFFSTKDRGTGLGLAISARIMEAHRGTIRVESGPGRGTSFLLSLPQLEAEGQRA